MSKMWMRSGLVEGTKVRIPNSLFIEPAKAPDRLISTTYVGENDYGIMIDCKFQPCIRTNNPNGSHYRMMINWASIWCGHIKVYLEDGTMLRAIREKGLPLTDEQRSMMYE